MKTMRFFKSAVQNGLLVFIFAICAYSTSMAQCGMEDHHPDSRLYTLSPSCDVDISNTPIKTVRVTVHVFHKDDGSGNIPDNSTGNNWITGIVNAASNSMGYLQPMNLSTPSPYFQDAKIRYELMNIYHWNNTTMHNTGDNTIAHGNILHNFIMGQNVAYKNSSIHIMLPGNYTADKLRMAGVACGFGCGRWCQLEDIYHYYTYDNYWEPTNTLRHELGHNLDLRHSWKSDLCDDTPTHNNCWNADLGCSNNVMDTNNSRLALTLDQVSRMHIWLHNSGDYLLVDEDEWPITMQINDGQSQQTFPSSNFIKIHSPSATLYASSPDGSDYTWTKVSGTGTISAPYGSPTATLSNVDFITFKVTWTASCVEYSETYEVLALESYFSFSPNPTLSDITLEVNNSEEILDLARRLNGKSSGAIIGECVLRNRLGAVVWRSIPPKDATQLVIPLSKFKSGTYYLSVNNGKLSFKKILIKI